jgi:hypothetical protein
VIRKVDFGANDVGTHGQGGRLEVDRWYLVTYVVDDATKECRVYLDGDLKKTFPYKGTPRLMQPGQKLRIGCSWGNEFMDGVIDDVKIWNRPLRFLLRHMHVVCAHLSDGGRQAVIMQSDAGPED